MPCMLIASVPVAPLKKMRLPSVRFLKRKMETYAIKRTVRSCRLARSFPSPVRAGRCGEYWRISHP